MPVPVAAIGFVGVFVLFERDSSLVVDRHKRMRADEILLHPWILNIGQSKTIRNTEELKTILRLKYESKIKEYAAESTGP